MEAKLRIPFYITLIYFFIILHLSPVCNDIIRMIVTKKYSSITMYFLIYFFVLISSLSIAFFYTLFMQDSFRKSELFKLIQTREIQESHWYKEVGFFQVFLTHSIHIVFFTLIYNSLLDLFKSN